jgi:hypothetical protein
MARLENSVGVENGLVEPSPQAHPPEGIYIASTLVQGRQEVLVRVLNATHRDQTLTRRSFLAHCKTATLTTDRYMENPRPKAENRNYTK